MCSITPEQLERSFLGIKKLEPVKMPFLSSVQKAVSNVTPRISFAPPRKDIVERVTEFKKEAIKTALRNPASSATNLNANSVEVEEAIQEPTQQEATQATNKEAQEPTEEKTIFGIKRKTFIWISVAVVVVVVAVVIYFKTKK